MVILGYLVILGILVGDFYFGDFRSFQAIAWHATYKVLRGLPSRLFVCQREGAAFLPQDGNLRISEQVTGIAYFNGMALICELRGLIVQLKPLDRQDWAKAW